MLHMPRVGDPAKSKFIPKEVIEDLAEEHIGEMYEADQLKQVLELIGFTNVRVIETFQWLPQTAWEWDRIIYYRIKLLYPFLFPCLKFLQVSECFVEHRLQFPAGMFAY